jgi:hypothetical protein
MFHSKKTNAKVMITERCLYAWSKSFKKLKINKGPNHRSKSKNSKLLTNNFNLPGFYRLAKTRIVK